MKIELKFNPFYLFHDRFCAQKWDGSSLVMGTMYSYDIFAAMPCCTERLKVSYIVLKLIFFKSYQMSLPNKY